MSFAFECRNRRVSICWNFLLVFSTILLFATTVSAQSGRRAVAYVSVCSDGTVPGTTGACPANTTDTEQFVLAPSTFTNCPGKYQIRGRCPINFFGDLGNLADEHSTIFPPKYLPEQSGEYLFFVTGGHGMSVLRSTALVNGQWTLDFNPKYGHYKRRTGNGYVYGPVFSTAMDHKFCPTVQTPADDDPTFDLNYAGPGTVILDPTNTDNSGPGNLLMIYEGTNRCIGTMGGNNTEVPVTVNNTTTYVSNKFYATIAVATSNDYGVNWPDYRYLLDSQGNLLYPLPYRNPCDKPNENCNSKTLCENGMICIGPNQPPDGSLGDKVCVGSMCVDPKTGATITPNPLYGRYPIFSPKQTIAQTITAQSTVGWLPNPVGYQAPSAFLDDASGNSFPYVYVTAGGMHVTRGQLNGGKQKLAFDNWAAGAFTSSPPGMPSGIGGNADPMTFLGSQNKPVHCEGAGQNQTMAQFSYVEDTQQYIVTFVCMSPNGDPATQSGNSGAAWFYATTDDMSRQDHWSTPQEIVGSWTEYNPVITKCADWDGWYPSFMSLDANPNHFSYDGYAFYMTGCLDKGIPGGRRYTSRQFTINWKKTQAFQGLDASHAFVLDTGGNLWMESGTFGTTSAMRVKVDKNVDTFQAIQDGTNNVLVLDMDGNLSLEAPPYGSTSRTAVATSVRSFEALNSSSVYVLGNDGNLRVETAPFGGAGQFVAGTVRAFEALTASSALVLHTDGNLYREEFSVAAVAQTLIDGNVLGFQHLAGTQKLYVLGTDGNLWLERPPYGSAPPPRTQVDANVRYFHATDENNAYVLGTDGNLWLENATWGTVPPARTQVDGNVRAFDVVDLSNVYVLGTDGKLWLEPAPFGTVPPPNRLLVDTDVK